MEVLGDVWVESSKNNLVFIALMKQDFVSRRMCKDALVRARF